MTENLAILELEVEEARAKLANDLAVLRSPQTYRQFTAGLKSEAQSVFERILDELKARAAANPSAALAIGAGIGWRLLKHPPIATALIGAGLLSLWRTTPVRVDEKDYLTTAQQRFGEQVSEAVETIKDYAAETVGSAQEKASEYAKGAQEKVQVLAASAAEKAAEGIDQAGEAARSFPDHAKSAAQRATSQFGAAVRDQGVRDQLLLGVAGLAVAAAVGVAYQRQASDEWRRWE
jgi:hypothetical protein